MARILVIDDSPTILLAVRQALAVEGHRVEGLDSFVELPGRLRDNPPDLIVLDLQIPYLPGVAFGRLIRKFQSRSIPIVIYSGQPIEEIEVAAKAIGAAGSVPKGHPPQLLREAVDRALSAQCVR